MLVPYNNNFMLDINVPIQPFMQLEFGHLITNQSSMLVPYNDNFMLDINVPIQPFMQLKFGHLITNHDNSSVNSIISTTYRLYCATKCQAVVQTRGKKVPLELDSCEKGVVRAMNPVGIRGGGS